MWVVWRRLRSVRWPSRCTRDYTQRGKIRFDRIQVPLDIVARYYPLMIRQAACFFLFLSTPALADNLFVADDNGLREVDYNGKTIRNLVAEKASRPRMMPDHKELLFFAHDKGEIRRVALDTGAITTVTKLPSKFRLCEKVKKGESNRQPEYPLSELDIQAPGDFTVDRSGQFACINLMDRNANMADVAFELRVPLNGGKLVTMVSIPSGCETPKVSNCRPVKPEIAKAPRGRYSVQDGWLTAGQKKITQLGPGDFTKEVVSPSGKWAVIGGNVQENDYIERTIFLLDQQAGAIHTISAKSTVLTSSQLRTMDTQSAGAVGETDIHWVSDDALVVGSKLFSPGKGAVDLGGEVAR